MPDGIKEIIDTDTNGFRLKLNKSGPPSFYYRYEDGPVYLGNVDYQTPEGAREICRELRAAREEHARVFGRKVTIQKLRELTATKRDGVPPGNNKLWTVADLFGEFLKFKEAGSEIAAARARNHASFRNSPEFERIADYNIPQLTPELLEREIKSGTVKRVSSGGIHKGEATANRHLGYLGEAIAWGMKTHKDHIGLDHRKDSPSLRVERFSEVAGERREIFYSEDAIRSLLLGITTFEARDSSIVVLAFIFLLASGQRQGAVRHTLIADVMENDIRFDGRMSVYWSPEVMKSKRPFALPCSDLMERIVCLCVVRLFGPFERLR
jgi:hypothetical protein